MSNTTRILYQKETGLGLKTINAIVDNPLIGVGVVCPRCEHHFNEAVYPNRELLDYVEWLENLVEKVPPFLIP